MPTIEELQAGFSSIQQRLDASAAAVEAIRSARAKACLTPADVVAAYRGHWAAPLGTGPVANRTFSGAHPTHCHLPDGRVRLTAMEYDALGYGDITPPQPSTSSTVPVPSSVTWGALPTPSRANTPNASGTHKVGLIHRDGQQYASLRAFYAVSGADYPSQMRGSDGFWPVGFVGTAPPTVSAPTHHNKVAGGMIRPPSSKSSRWDYLLTLCGTPGEAISSCGLGLCGVSWSSGTPVGEVLMGADYAHRRAYWDSVLSVRGGAWIETPTKHGILFAARRSLGPIWYGDGNGKQDDGKYVNKPANWPASPLYLTTTPTAETVSDPWDSSKGYHSTDYDRGCWIVDPAKLEKGNLQIEPEAWVSFQSLGWLSDLKRVNGAVVAENAHKAYVSAAARSDTSCTFCIGGGWRAGDWTYNPLFLEFEF